MRIVTLAIGELFEQMASITMPIAEQHLGQKVEILSAPAGSDPFLFKMRLLRDSKEYPLLCIDADMVFLSWDWSAFDLTKFNGVLDYNLESWAGGTLRDIGVDATRSINGGMWMALPEHIPVFERAVELMEGQLANHFLNLHDQTALNLALQEAGTEVHMLPLSFNHQVSPRHKLSDVPENTRVVHLVGNSVGPGEKYNMVKKLERVKEAIKCLIV